jgi:hypothetical protein
VWGLPHLSFHSPCSGQHLLRQRVLVPRSTGLAEVLPLSSPTYFRPHSLHCSQVPQSLWSWARGTCRRPPFCPSHPSLGGAEDRIKGRPSSLLPRLLPSTALSLAEPQVWLLLPTTPLSLKLGYPAVLSASQQVRRWVCEGASQTPVSTSALLNGLFLSPTSALATGGQRLLLHPSAWGLCTSYNWHWDLCTAMAA